MTDEHDHDYAHAIPPDPMTEACLRFFRDHWQLQHFIGFISSLATGADKRSTIAAKALYNAAGDDAEKARFKEMMERDPGAVTALRSHRQLILQMMICRAVDNYLTYVSELMALVFTSRPETLKTRDSVRIDVLLEYGTMEELVSGLAEKRVNDLSYRGMRDLSDYLAERLGFPLFQDPVQLERAVRVIEVRNLIVHNRAVVNRTFFARLPSYSAKLGQDVELDVDPVFDDIEFLCGSRFSIGRAGSCKIRAALPRTSAVPSLPCVARDQVTHLRRREAPPAGGERRDLARRKRALDAATERAAETGDALRRRG